MYNFNELISLIDQAILMSMEPTAGIIGVVLQGKFVQVDYYYGRGARVLNPITFFASFTHTCTINDSSLSNVSTSYKLLHDLCQGFAL